PPIPADTEVTCLGAGVDGGWPTIFGSWAKFFSIPR
ncbi:unnamed protein product, partial [Allacma fusca]